MKDIIDTWFKLSTFAWPKDLRELISLACDAFSPGFIERAAFFLRSYFLFLFVKTIHLTQCWLLVLWHFIPYWTLYYVLWLSNQTIRLQRIDTRSLTINFAEARVSGAKSQQNLIGKHSFLCIGWLSQREVICHELNELNDFFSSQPLEFMDSIFLLKCFSMKNSSTDILVAKLAVKLPNNLFCELY